MKLERLALPILLSLGLAACGGGDETASEAPEGRAVTETRTAVQDDTETDNPIVARSLAGDPGPADEYAVIRTNYGDIKLRFFPKQAPLAVANFKGLAARDYFDGLFFHRVIKNFIIQSGDPTATGTGGESLWGKPFRDEFDPALVFGRGGLVGMANPQQRNSNESQFFITHSAAMHLNNKHTLFAEVMEGMATVDAIANLAVNADARPLEPAIIEDVIIASE